MKRTTSSTWMRSIAEMLGSEGLDARSLFADAGIDPDALADPDHRVPFDRVSRVWALAVERSGRPTIGLAAPGTAQLGSFDVLGYAMMSCSNLLGAMQRLARYLRVVTEGGEVSVAQHGDECRVAFELFCGEVPVPDARYDFDLLVFVRFCRWISGRDLRLAGVEMARPAPGDTEAYAQAFGCPVRFNAERHELVFALADVMQPLPTSNAALAGVHDQLLGEHLERMGRQETTHRARELIRVRLPDGEPKRELVARELHMSERTLHRRLADEGTSFQSLLDDVRQELARRYLAQRRLTLAQTAYLLGFADQSNFTRACKRWFGSSPGLVRERSLQRDVGAIV